MRSIGVLVSAAVLASLASCGGSGGGGGGSLSLSGTILGSPAVPRGGAGGPQGLAGVVVEVSTNASTKQATTDANGNFIVLKPPSGMVHVHIDGSGAAGGTYASLELAFVIGGGASNLSQPIVLPNLDAGQTLAVMVDGGGVTMGDTMVGDPALDGFSLDIPDMTTILVDGAPPVGSVDVNVTPVAAIDVPMPLPGTQNPGAFVTIQPAGATFSPALGITLPNPGNLPLGTMVDIWSFDHQDGAWVNRSEQTGNRGTVVDIMGTTFIVADQVITEGGWHAGTLPVDPECATIIAGQVFTLGAPTPLRDVLISLSTGQFARTDASGRFSIPSVPAYNAALLPKVCEAVTINLRAIAPVAFGSNQVSMDIPAGTIVTGGTTNVPAFDIPVTSTGSLVGSVTDLGNPVAGKVTITGVENVSAESDSFGSFFVAALDPGAYNAAFGFTSGEVSKDFSIVANQTTTVNLASRPPSGVGTVTVQVLDFSTLDMPVGVPDACVTLQGASGGPRFATANGSGIATFNNAPAGPYSVTAQQDVNLGFGTARLASSLVGVSASGNPAMIVLPFFDDPGFGSPVVTDATLQGSILNEPGGLNLDYQIALDQAPGFFASGTANGGFSAAIPSGLPLDVAVSASDPSTGEVQSAFFFSDVMANPGQTLMLDFDFANAVPFDLPVTLAYTNAQVAHDDYFAGLFLGDLEFGFSDSQSLPTSVNWPSFSNVKLANLAPFFEVGSSTFVGTFRETDCCVPLGNSTPSSLQIGFLGIPAIQAPANNANFATYGPGNVVQFTLGSPNGSTAGFNDVTFFGESKLNNTTYFWDILAAPGVTSVTLPPVFASKPMFPDGFYVVDVGPTRFDFPGFNFASFWDQNLPANVLAVVASTICSASQSHFFTVGGLALEAGARRNLERRIRQAPHSFAH